MDGMERSERGEELLEAKYQREEREKIHRNKREEKGGKEERGNEATNRI